MRLYEWSLQNKPEDIASNLIQYQQDTQSSRCFHAWKVLTLLAFICVEPVSIYEDSRGTVHYRQNTTFSICSIKTVDGETCAKGIAFFDIVDRSILVMLFFIMMIVSCEPLIGATILSSIVYIVVSFIGRERDSDDLRSLERQVRDIGDVQ